jgi:transmembrane sensor
MSNEELILLAEKVEKGVANNQELLLYAFICETFQKQGLDSEVPEEELLEREEAGLAMFWSRHKRKTLWPRIAVAASVLVVAGVGLLFYLNSHRPGPAFVDIAAGKQGATLTLASGKKIRLTDQGQGELAKEAGVTITKTTSGQITYEIKQVEGNAINQYNTISTANGETYLVMLPDKSKVWINAASSLRYPLGFSRNERKVQLTGEGYFEIAAEHVPFIVETKNQKVEVLGTHFNISSYEDDDSVKTTLLEGAVKVNNVLLKPDQQAILSAGTIHVVDVNAADYVAWKNGLFKFTNDENITSVMRKLARWYNIDVEYKGNMQDVNFTGTMSRSKKISSLLNMMQETGMVKFKMEGRKVIVESTNN